MKITTYVLPVGALAILLMGIVLAALVPAWRASRVDPIEALREG